VANKTYRFLKQEKEIFLSTAYPDIGVKPLNTNGGEFKGSAPLTLLRQENMQEEIINSSLLHSLGLWRGRAVQPTTGPTWFWVLLP
jgi:hypothetical protein